MNVGGTFSGIGGLDRGLALAGLRHQFLCEIDAYRRSVLAAHFPGVRIFEDVREVGGDAGPVDLLCGGFPCTDLSIAGRRAGIEGSESGLFFEFARIASDLRPEWVLLENVPGLFSSNGGRDFGVVLGEMADLGYGLAWRVVDSRYFGVPQRRRRVFIVGALADGDPRAAAERAGLVLGVGERCARHPRTSAEAREADPAGAEGSSREAGPSYYVEGAENATLRANGDGGARTDKQPLVVSPLAGGAGGGLRMDADTVDQLVSPAVTSKWAKGSGGPSGDETQNLVFTVEPERGQGADLTIRNDDLSPTLDADRNERGSLVVSVSENQRGELREGDIAPQFSAGGGKPGVGYAAVRDEQRVRRLTPIEAERLQGLPDGWTDPDGNAANTNRYAAIGDAVTVTVGQWLGERLVSVHESR